MGKHSFQEIVAMVSYEKQRDGIRQFFELAHINGLWSVEIYLKGGVKRLGNGGENGCA